MRLAIYALLLLSAAATLSHGANDTLLQRFQNPPAEARPFVRWWWNGNYAEKSEIVREIDIMKAAGIGGFEINPIALPPVSSKPTGRQMEWLSPEWNNLVKFTADQAHQRGMITDLIVGSGWPFGGEFLPTDQTVQKLDLITIPVNGPRAYSVNINTLMQQRTKPKDENANPDAPPTERLFVKLIPQGIDSLDQVVDLNDRVAPDGTLSLQLPAGRQVVCIGVVLRGFRTVMHGAPGAMGPVLDHYNQPSVTAYLDRMAQALNPLFGGRLGNGIRAIFCDSIELSGANWTGDLPGEFARRRGYAIEPWLPWLTGFNQNQPVTPGANMADTIRRVRYDFCKTLTELFLERFTRTYHDWCHANGTISRYQAYGIPFLMELAEGYLIPDIPETNNWLFTDPDSHGFLVWTKYCSSGGHLAGRKIISSEAMTNTGAVYRTTLEQIKAADDYNFIMGINHSVLHGFNYSPPSAGFPGWVRYGAYFSEQNTWWPYFHYWSDYNARLSALFQTAEPVVSVAIMGPTADVWSTAGLARPPFHQTPWYLHQLWKTISNCGGSADYLGEGSLQRARFADGKICAGPMAYNALIVCGVESLQPQTAQALADYARCGGKIAFIERLPNRAPGLFDAETNDRAVASTIAQLVKEHNPSVKLLPAPQKETLLHWTDALLDQLKVTRSVKFDQLSPDLYQIHYRHEGRDIYFLCNQNPHTTASVTAQFQTKNTTAWLWDPQTGQTTALKSGAAAPHLPVKLAPLESSLIVFDNQQATSIVEPVETQTTRTLTLDQPWRAEFNPCQSEPFTLDRFKLADLSQSKMDRLAQFAGTITYTATIDLNPANSKLQLDLDKVYNISAVSLNGQSLGVRWFGQHRYDLTPAARLGANTLEIKVTTLLNNYTRTLNQVEASRWYPPKGDKPTVPAGLVGPVTIEFQH